MNADKQAYCTLATSLLTGPFDLRFWDDDTVHLGTGKPAFLIHFQHPLPPRDLLQDPLLALGDAYIAGQVEVEGRLQALFESLYSNHNGVLHQLLEQEAARRHEPGNSTAYSRSNAQAHYDHGNDFYALWLDETMSYSCAYFEHPGDALAQAQRQKIHHILRKLDLRPGEHLLDIGCGWGELMLTAARDYGVRVTGITLSEQQLIAVEKKIREQGLEAVAKARLEDYRELQGKYDKIASVGMAEHVGQEHLPDYFQTIRSSLVDGGLALVHCITAPRYGGTNNWINQYIFPGGYIPALRELIHEIAEQDFYVLDVESLRRHYMLTLQAWARNFEARHDAIARLKDPTFIRTWRLYLNGCAAAFHQGNIDLHQILISRGINNGLPMTRRPVYESGA